MSTSNFYQRVAASHGTGFAPFTTIASTRQQGHSTPTYEYDYDGRRRVTSMDDRKYSTSHARQSSPRIFRNGEEINQLRTSSEYQHARAELDRSSSNEHTSRNNRSNSATNTNPSARVTHRHNTSGNRSSSTSRSRATSLGNNNTHGYTTKNSPRPHGVLVRAPEQPQSAAFEHEWYQEYAASAPHRRTSSGAASHKGTTPTQQQARLATSRVSSSRRLSTDAHTRSSSCSTRTSLRKHTSTNSIASANKSSGRSSPRDNGRTACSSFRKQPERSTKPVSEVRVPRERASTWNNSTTNVIPERHESIVPKSPHKRSTYTNTSSTRTNRSQSQAPLTDSRMSAVKLSETFRQYYHNKVPSKSMTSTGSGGGGGGTTVRSNSGVIINENQLLAGSGGKSINSAHSSRTSSARTMSRGSTASFGSATDTSTSSWSTASNTDSRINEHDSHLDQYQQHRESYQANPAHHVSRHGNAINSNSSSNSLRASPTSHSSSIINNLGASPLSRSNSTGSAGSSVSYVSGSPNRHHGSLTRREQQSQQPQHEDYIDSHIHVSTTARGRSSADSSSSDSRERYTSLRLTNNDPQLVVPSHSRTRRNSTSSVSTTSSSEEKSKTSCASTSSRIFRGLGAAERDRRDLVHQRRRARASSRDDTDSSCSEEHDFVTDNTELESSGELWNAPGPFGQEEQQLHAKQHKPVRQDNKTTPLSGSVPPKVKKTRKAGESEDEDEQSNKCDRCDGAHPTDDCPWFKKERDDHPDALRRKCLAMGSSGGNVVVHNARVVTQPGDGSCLFHSLGFGLGGSTNAHQLRKEIARYIKRNPELMIADTPLKDWIKWDSNSSVDAYASRMARSGWGGGIECAAFSHLYNVNVHIYERKRGGSGFLRISCFDTDEPKSARGTVNVLYCGGVHYNSLVIPTASKM